MSRIIIIIMKLLVLWKRLVFLGVLTCCVLILWNTLDKIQLRSLSSISSGRLIANAQRQDGELNEIMEVAWPIIGGFKGTPFNDLGYVRSFLKSREMSAEWKTILRVGSFNFDHLEWTDGWEHLKRTVCPVSRCFFTSNRSSSKKADAVIISEFHEHDLEFLMPKPRRQIWIVQHLESPYHNRLSPKLLNRLANWTATYRLDSTIALPQSIWIPVDSRPSAKQHERNYAVGRSKKVAMFVSNCNDKNGRLHYARELSRYIKVDIYGKCGTSECPKRTNTTIYSDPCHEIVKRNYKFYLSFENSNCIGYITEKLHINALFNDIVPIVMGARPEDYATAAPPGSYIHVDDFKSPRHLGDYLNLLDSNDSLYNEFFRYKLRYRQIRRNQLTGVYWCHLCTLLHLNDYMNITRRWYDDYEKWWNGACNATDDADKPWKTWKKQANT